MGKDAYRIFNYSCDAPEVLCCRIFNYSNYWAGAGAGAGAEKNFFKKYWKLVDKLKF